MHFCAHSRKKKLMMNGELSSVSIISTSKRDNVVISCMIETDDDDRETCIKVPHDFSH